MGQVNSVFYHEAGTGTWGLFGGYPNGGDSEGVLLLYQLLRRLRPGVLKLRFREGRKVACTLVTCKHSLPSNWPGGVQARPT